MKWSVLSRQRAYTSQADLAFTFMDLSEVYKELEAHCEGILLIGGALAVWPGMPFPNRW
jgi:hypothetical protein